MSNRNDALRIAQLVSLKMTKPVGARFLAMG
jgi:hypothetical protein